MHYNDPGLRPVEFLRAVMHDPKADIADRVRAATALLAIEPYCPPQPTVLIRITGISDDDMQAASWWPEWVAFSLEQQRYFNSLPKHEQDDFMRVIHRLERCNELDVGELNVRSEVKGHA